MGALRDRAAQLSLAVAEREDRAIGTKSRLVMTKGGLVDALARACRLTRDQWEPPALAGVTWTRAGRLSLSATCEGRNCSTTQATVSR